MAAGVTAEVAWNCGFRARTALVGTEDPVHLHALEPFSLDWIAFSLSPSLSFCFQICTLQVGTLVSCSSQETRGLLIRVAATDYKFCHGKCNTNTPRKLSGGKAQVVLTVWKGL